ncbi:leucine-rich repeat-containing protein 74A-like [Melanotaenia boesemani]|uniref:leucine-rich repeat-containing protein 74A-like n=1 Tax=Melanotaenia boesemani TaxID=1250792 RepID=UPI001C03F82A|nr:leucine-rich repeat-containing protein 74A-like [Melanotaenia boesemani]
MDPGQEASQSSQKQQPCDKSALCTKRQDKKGGKKKTSGDEWDTDLEENNVQQGSFYAELYLQACQQTGTLPVSQVLHHMNEETLNLNHYGLGPQRAKALAIALQNNNVVTHLELQNNDLGAEGAYYLMEMLETNPFIQSLNLSMNQLGLEGARVISKILINNLNITSIKLSGNDLDDAAAECLSESLQRNSAIKELNLSSNIFSEAEGKHLGDMLDDTCIEVLNLSWNNLRMKYAVALSANLKVNSRLKELYLSSTGFGRSEVEALGKALKENETLVLLDLSRNRICDQAVMLLCHGLTTNSTLKVLKLFHNPMSRVGALTLITTVRNNMNSALDEIDISSVVVREAFVEVLEEIRQRRPSMDVRYTILPIASRNLAAFNTFKKFLEEQNKSIRDFFKSFDKEGTMIVSTSAFRKAVMEANMPLDKHQLEWLVRKFDKNFTATINYSQIC